jgi:hypothetical protein
MPLIRKFTARTIGTALLAAAAAGLMAIPAHAAGSSSGHAETASEQPHTACTPLDPDDTRWGCEPLTAEDSRWG